MENVYKVNGRSFIDYEDMIQYCIDNKYYITDVTKLKHNNVCIHLVNIISIETAINKNIK